MLTDPNTHPNAFNGAGADAEVPLSFFGLWAEICFGLRPQGGDQYSLKRLGLHVFLVLFSLGDSYSLMHFPTDSNY